MDTRRIPASLNIRPVRLDSDTRMEGEEEEEEAASPVTTPTIHRPGKTKTYTPPTDGFPLILRFQDHFVVFLLTLTL